MADQVDNETGPAPSWPLSLQCSTTGNDDALSLQGWTSQPIPAPPESPPAGGCCPGSGPAHLQPAPGPPGPGSKGQPAGLLLSQPQGPPGQDRPQQESCPEGPGDPEGPGVCQGDIHRQRSDLYQIQGASQLTGPAIHRPTTPRGVTMTPLGCHHDTARGVTMAPLGCHHDTQTRPAELGHFKTVLSHTSQH